MTDATQKPPRGAGALEKREARLALLLLAPTFAIVALVVLVPLIMNFWISAKPVMLADLRPPEANINERVSSDEDDVAAGGTFEITYTLRNTSPSLPVEGAGFSDEIPTGATIAIDDDRCAMTGQTLTCDVGELEPRARERFKFEATATEPIADVEDLFEGTVATSTGSGENALLNLNFTWDNFVKVFDGREFWTVLWTSIVYAVFGTGGALLLGLFAALLLNNAFKGRAFLRGLFLFPYVAPVIAVAYTWITLLDPNSGTLNAILMQMGATNGPINFLGQRTAFDFTIFGTTIEFPMALTTVIVFEAWRYFPLSFLFILARMQSINTDMYEAAEIDGASPFQQFWYLSLPQLATILAILFLLRYIWTFNKFDDIFLLTGGAAGTRTLTVNVYEQAIGLGNIGAGAAVAVVVFVVLLLFALVFFRFSPKES
ncbi:transporter [Acuticoccus sediminis]|uniref:Transporter n=1 Tax=Acuticoccus sediminis TaxID=2184697 RepID=A0A8B2NJS3_9HYPH|nr:sugar ABC transporter permease [Acuticoccus sediminis]RAH99874.1 transporter [Acuticoccus sediminis]